MRTLTFCLLALLLLSGCYSYSEKVEAFGVMTYTSYYRAPKWEPDGYHPDFYRDTFCPAGEVSPKPGARIKNRCIIGRDLTVYNSNHGDIVQLTVTEALENEPMDKEIYYFDTKHGTEIPCDDCWMTKHRVRTGIWLKQGTVFMSDAQAIGHLNVVPMLMFSDGKATESAFAYRDARPRSKGESNGRYLSPDESQVAWVICYPECVIYWLEKDLETVNWVATGCESTAILPHWSKRGVVVAEDSIYRDDKKRCRHSDGRSKYPLRAGDEDDENDLVPEDDGKIVDYEWQFAARKQEPIEALR